MARRPKPIKPSDLPSDAGGTFLYCRKCHGEFSATRGDYFNRDQDKVMKCHGVNLVHVRRVCELVEVTA